MKYCNACKINKEDSQFKTRKYTKNWKSRTYTYKLEVINKVVDKDEFDW